MRSRAATGHRVRLVFYFARRALRYNVALSLLGAGALRVIGLAELSGTETVFAGALPAASGSVAATVRSVAFLAVFLVATAGYGLSAAVMALFHGSERPLYWNAGITPAGIFAGAWALAALSAAALAAAVGLVTG